MEVVPEATAAVVERVVPGLAEAMRAAWRRGGVSGASLHRGITGIRGRTLIVNLPAGSEASTLFLEAALGDLPYVLAHLRGDAQAVTLDEIIRSSEGEGDEVVDEAKAREQRSLPSRVVRV